MAILSPEEIMARATRRLQDQKDLRSSEEEGLARIWSEAWNAKEKAYSDTPLPCYCGTSMTEHASGCQEDGWATWSACI